MTAPTVTIDGENLPLLPGESVLDCLLRHERPVDHSCRAGHCQACLVQGTPAPPDAQAGLKPSLAEQGFFLACQAYPKERVTLSSVAGAAPIRCVLQSSESIGEGIARLRFVARDSFAYRPGQFVNVRHPDGALRSYSLASVTAEDFLEIHVRRIPGGLVSNWLCTLQPGAELEVRGPNGTCYYLPGDDGDVDRPLILAGTGTGLSPLWGILRDALAQGHRGPIHLLQGALRADRLYLIDELGELCRATEGQLRLHLCALEGSDVGPITNQPLDACAHEVTKSLAAAPRAFLCGDPAIVSKLQRALFIAGVASVDILADPFLPTPTPVATA